MSWWVHIVLTRGDENVSCHTYEDAEELMGRILMAMEDKGAVVLDDGMILGGSQIVKAWPEATT